MKSILITLLLFFSAVVFAQLTLRHSPIEGSTGRQLGYSVALANNGNTLAVGAPFALGERGSVQLYQNASTGWETSNGERLVGPENEKYGLSLNLSESGEHLVIGGDNPAPSLSGRNNSSFQLVDDRWRFISLVFPTQRGSGRCCSAALSGNGLRMVVGAPRFNFANVVYRNDNGWFFDPTRLQLNGASPESFGTSVAMSGDGRTVFVAEIPDRSDVLIGGTIKAFRQTASWQPLGNLLVGSSEDMIGEAMATNEGGNIVAFTVNDQHVNGQGSVDVFQLSLNNRWEQRGGRIRSRVPLGGRFGETVALSKDGDRLVIGSPTTDAEGPLAGQVNLYEWNGNDWELLATETSFAGAGGRFGHSVDISQSGNTIAVGANLATINNGEQAGLVAVYDYAPLTSSSNPQELPVSVISEPGAFRITPETTLAETTDLFVFATNGQRVGNWRLPRQGQLEIKHSFPKGIYFLRFSSGNRMNTVKVLVP